MCDARIFNPKQLNLLSVCVHTQSFGIKRLPPFSGMCIFAIKFLGILCVWGKANIYIFRDFYSFWLPRLLTAILQATIVDEEFI